MQRRETSAESQANVLEYVGGVLLGQLEPPWNTVDQWSIPLQEEIPGELLARDAPLNQSGIARISV